MSDTPQPRTLPGPRELDIAKVVLKKVLGGEGGVTVILPQPEGHPEVRVVVDRHRFLIFGLGLKVALARPHPYCRQCGEAVERMRAPETEEGLAYLLHEVSGVVQHCTCTQPTPAAAAVQAQPAQRIGQPVQRVKIISTSEPAAPGSSAKDTIRLTKSKGVTVVEDGRETGTEEARTEKFTAPSIRFQPGPHTQVEVTIPRYVCEALVRHCSESNYHKREVGGVIVGYQEESQDESSGLRVYTNIVTDLIHFKPTDSSGAHLSLDADSWVHISNIYEERYQSCRKTRLGWYHTHPTQGIFFSQPDHDFHTNFNQPFQFAVVVNPRNMEAGLVYWKNYENRVTEEPIFFSLKRRNDGRNAGGSGTLPPETDANESSPIAWVRILFFALVTTLVVGYVVTQSPPFSVRPGNACLLAFNVLVGLRLLNANFFRPKERVEDRLWVVLREWWWWALSRVALALDRHPSLGYAISLLTLILAVFLLFRGVWSPQRAESNVPGQSKPQAGSGGVPTSATQRRAERIHLDLFYGERELSISTEDGALRVLFQKMPNGQWEPLSPEAEKVFLRYVFKIDVRGNQPSAEIRSLQQRIYSREGREAQVDGVWGPRIRNALLNELMRGQGEEVEWPIPSAGGQSRHVVVRAVQGAGAQ